MSNNLDLSQVAAAQNQKEVTINDQAGQLDAALTESADVDVSAGNVTVLSATYQRNIRLNVIGATTPGRTVTLPAVKRLMVVTSAAANTQSIDLVRGSTSITVPPDTTVLVYTDATANGLAIMAKLLPEGTLGELSDLSDIALVTPAIGQMLRYDGADWTNEEVPYDLMVFLPGPFAAGSLMVRILFDRDVTFPENFTGSRGRSGTNATGDTVLDVQKNGANVGTITFTNAGATATFALSGGASFVAGDYLDILNEDPADSTLADVALALKGLRA